MKTEARPGPTKFSRGRPAPRAVTVLALCLAFGSLQPGSRAQTPSLVLTPKWSLATTARADLSATDNEARGIAINKLTGNVLLATRTQSNHVAVLSGVDGSDLGALNNAGISAGTLATEQVRVADDGAIYLCNLYGGSGSSFKIYRWNSETDGFVNPPTLAFGPGVVGSQPAQRYGDSMDLRGGGTNIQIIVSGAGASVFAIFTTLDGTNFTATEFTLPAGVGAGEFGKGISFDGTNNAFYAKNSGSSEIRYVSFDLAAATAALVSTISVTPDSNLVGIKSATTNGVAFIVGVVTSTSTAVTDHHFKAYTINNPASPQVSGDFIPPEPGGNNGNLTGAGDVGAGMTAGLDTDNGIQALAISFVTNLPPTVVSQPQNQGNVLQGGYVTLALSANGTGPLHYQWLFNTNTVVAGATNSSLTLSNLTLANGGYYRCVITNAAGSVTSRDALLGITPAALSSAAVPLWSKSVGDLFFLANDNTCRGLAFNPLTGHLIAVSRSPTNGVHVLDAATGAYLKSLDTSGILGGGVYLVNLAGVADDGAIYVANLDTGGTSYNIYRWADEDPATVAAIAYGPDDPGVGGRIGDTLAVRGAGLNTEILAGSRNGTAVALFTTSDGATFHPNVIDVATEPAGLAGLGIAFGAGDTFWTKSGGYQFRHVAFDLSAGTNGLLQTFAAGQNTSQTVAVDPVNDLLAGTALATPDNVELYNVHEVVNGLAAEPSLIDQDFFETDNDNDNGTGALAFDVAGGRLFALDTNNGLLALKVIARLLTSTSGQQVTFTWAGPSALQTAASLSGPWTSIEAASPFTTASPNSTIFYRLLR